MLLDLGHKPCATGDEAIAAQEEEPSTKKSTTAQPGVFPGDPHVLTTFRMGPRDLDRGMICMGIHLPPAKLQSQGVWAGERDVEQTEGGKTQRRTQRSRKELVPVTHSPEVW